MYSDTLLDHFRSPRNVGMMRNADAVGESEDPTCGDLARFYLRVRDGQVAEARFQTYGCGPSIAASSLVTELIRDRGIEELGELSAEAVERALGGLPAERRHAATLVVEALRVAAERYRSPREVSRV
ncbi:MAG TPA: iron-sulfur cluster assembly scaffold protein [Methylomirabilota bacterium]|jgi:nitrogen fixation NifU-like protein|nr:iron-sulfur cluster assembly scaffold protein [Methylomirabilota bacterium]